MDCKKIVRERKKEDRKREKERNWKMNRRLTSSLLVFSFSVLAHLNQKLRSWHCQKQSPDMIQIHARI